MELVNQALRAGRRQHAADAVVRTVLVAGAAGTLGAEIVERLLSCVTFASVRVLVTQPFCATTRRLEPVLLQELSTASAAPLAIVVFDRARHANGRDAAFHRPQPTELPDLAARLRDCGVRDLIIVMPHASGSLPDALKAGLASLDEQIVSALGFDRLAILRSARPPSALDSRGLQRLADMVLAQLRVMTPDAQQPLRARKIAQISVVVAEQIADAPPGTRVLAPERVWQLAQQPDPRQMVQAWLAGDALPDLQLAPRRM